MAPSVQIKTHMSSAEVDFACSIGLLLYTESHVSMAISNATQITKSTIARLARLSCMARKALRAALAHDASFTSLADSSLALVMA